MRIHIHIRLHKEVRLEIYCGLPARQIWVCPNRACPHVNKISSEDRFSNTGGKKKLRILETMLNNFLVGTFWSYYGLVK